MPFISMLVGQVLYKAQEMLLALLAKLNPGPVRFGVQHEDFGRFEEVGQEMEPIQQDGQRN